MKINCDGPSDNAFDPEEAINNWVPRGPGGRHIAGHKVPVPRVSVPNRLTAPATATPSQCQSKGQTVSTTLSDAERQSETEKANVNIHSSDSESSKTV